MATCVALLDDIVSSSNTAVPEIPVFKTALVSVLFVKTCEPVKVAIEVSAPIVKVSVALTVAVIPPEPITFNVSVPDIVWVVDDESLKRGSKRF